MAKIKPVIWIAAIDTREAKFYVEGKRLQPPFHKLHAVNNDFKPRNSLGRSFDSAGVARHVIEPHVSEEIANAQRFAKDIATFLRRAITKDDYDWLILAAPPEMLGLIRKALDNKVRDSIIKELHKDFMNLTPVQIQKHLDA